MGSLGPMSEGQLCLQALERARACSGGHPVGAAVRRDPAPREESLVPCWGFLGHGAHGAQTQHHQQPPRQRKRVVGEGGVLQQKGPSAGLGKQLIFNLGGTVSHSNRLCFQESTAPEATGPDPWDGQVVAHSCLTSTLDSSWVPSAA